VRAIGFLAAVVLAFPALADSPSARPIIDVHMHAYPADMWGGPGAPNPATGAPSSFVTDDDVMKASIAAMERFHIVRAVLSGPLERVDRWKAAAPHRFLASPHFPHFAKPPDVQWLREQFEAGHLHALAELTFQYVGVDPSDPSVEPYLALAEELDIPVGFHMGLSEPGISYGAAPGYRASKGNPLLLEEALVRHPQLRVYIMHAGWPFLDETIALMWAHPQVHAGLGVINWVIPRAEFHRYLERLVDAGLGKRLMFGSDQMVWPEAIGMAIDGIESAAFLTPDQKQDIFYDNAARFFRIEDARQSEEKR
jgi:predicted TIM-barrel fold metal-dependent hydrolase